MAVTLQTPKEAGPFSTWLGEIRGTLKEGKDAEVPRQSCTACCTSFQFIHIEPDEIGTLKAIPKQLLFDAPGAPAGYRVMGYTAVGHCPMFIESKCSIYENRPRTCRSYDCRIYSATDTAIDDPNRTEISKIVKSWQFSYESETDQKSKDQISLALNFIDAHNLDFNYPIDNSPTLRALIAIEISNLFLSRKIEDQTVDKIQAVNLQLKSYIG